MILLTPVGKNSFIGRDIWHDKNRFNFTVVRWTLVRWSAKMSAFTLFGLPHFPLAFLIGGMWLGERLTFLVAFQTEWPSCSKSWNSHSIDICAVDNMFFLI